MVEHMPATLQRQRGEAAFRGAQRESAAEDTGGDLPPTKDAINHLDFIAEFRIAGQIQLRF